jgi:hypothetical protein
MSSTGDRENESNKRKRATREREKGRFQMWFALFLASPVLPFSLLLSI